MKIKIIYLIILLFLLIGTVWVNCTVPIVYENNNINCSIKMNTAESVIRGTVVVYTVENIDTAIKLEKITVKIINAQNRIIGDAVIKENRILVDTSPLERGTYTIMLQYESNKTLVEQCFYVELI